MLLRDGTVIVVYNDAATGGDTATVGLQSDGTASGVAYSANQVAIFDGMSLYILPPQSGLGADLTIQTSELGIIDSRNRATTLHGVVRDGFANVGPSMGAGSGALAGAGPGVRTDGPWSIWGTFGALGIDGDWGPDVDGHDWRFQGGIDYRVSQSLIAGVSVGTGAFDMSVGIGSRLDGERFTVEPYVGYAFANWVATASLGFTRTDYDEFKVSIFGPGLDMSTRGDRVSGTLGVTGTYDLNTAVPLQLMPTAMLGAGRESIDDVAVTPGYAFGVDDADYVHAAAGAELSMPFGTHSGVGRVYGLALAEYADTSGDSTIALYAANYEDEALTATLGGGFEFVTASNLSLSVEARATGLGGDIRTFGAEARVGYRF